MKKKYALRALLTAAILVLTACGGGGGETNVEPVSAETVSAEPEQRPYRSFVLNQEEEVQTSFFEMTEEHLYEITVNYTSMINIKAKSYTESRYHEAGANSVNDSLGGTYYTVFDEYSNVITKFNISYNQEISHDINALQPGVYYLVVNFPLTYPGQDHKALSSISGDKSYDLFVTHYITAEDIHGTEEIDLLRGDYSDQTIYGYSGKDKIYGEGGSDIIYSGEGNDLIHGGIGADDLTGGEGQDIFLYTSVEESTFNLTERDIIRDFSITEDFIDISSLPEWNISYKYSPSNYFNGSEPDVAGYTTLWFVNGSLYGKRGFYQPANPDYDFVIELEGVTSLPVERIIFP
jgi:hypothetical protein